jgi:hypothetical protein
MLGELNIIGDVTDTLTDLLSDFDVTLDSPANLQTGGNNQFAKVNLYLYQVLEDPHSKNQNRVTKNNGQLQRPPLALDLFYLLTPYASDPLSAHRVLTQAMRVFYDHAIIEGPELAESLRLTVEQLAIVLVPLQLEDLTRIWNSLQTPYRLSVSYEVRIVLIESEHVSTPSRVENRVNLYRQKL